MWGRGEVVGKSVGKRPPERLDIDGRIILKWIFTFSPSMLLHLVYLKPTHALILKHIHNHIY
jgi:hypothetical protein